MEPALRDGQLVRTSRLRPTDEVRRGDLVLVRPGGDGRSIVKRVVGLPNEHVVLTDGRVLVDGRPLDEPYARRSIFTGQFQVPDGAYLLLGDNRDASHDSRIWADPYVPRRHLLGRLHPMPAWATGIRAPTRAG
ncbi:MAG TPA: signal peptidase I, partial [Candidatus Nanopelagicales bacterium]